MYLNFLLYYKEKKQWYYYIFELAFIILKTDILKFKNVIFQRIIELDKNIIKF